MKIGCSPGEFLLSAKRLLNGTDGRTGALIATVNTEAVNEERAPSTGPGVVIT